MESNDEIALKSIRNALVLLPLTNLLVIKNLVYLLANVASYSEFNKMIPSNLAIVFAPSLLRNQDETDIQSAIQDTKFSNKLMERFILFAEQLFEVFLPHSSFHPPPFPSLFHSYCKYPFVVPFHRSFFSFCREICFLLFFGFFVILFAWENSN